MEKWGLFSLSSFGVIGGPGAGKTNLIYHYLAHVSKTEDLIVHAVSKEHRPEYEYLTRAFNGRYGLYSDHRFLESILKEVEERRQVIGSTLFFASTNALRIRAGEKPLPRVVVIFEELAFELASEHFLTELARTNWGWARLGFQSIVSSRLASVPHVGFINHRTIFLGDSATSLNAKAVFQTERLLVDKPELHSPGKHDGVLLYEAKGKREVCPHLLKVPDVDYQGFLKKVRDK